MTKRREFFLLALFHGVNTSDQLLVTAASTQKIAVARQRETTRRAARYFIARRRLFGHLATQASRQMTDEALDILFGHVIDGDDRNLMAETVRHLAEHELLFPRLGDTLERGQPAPG